MTREQEFLLDRARSKVQQVLDYINLMLDDKEITQEDLDSDTSEAIDRCNDAIGFLYEAKKGL